jgi:hypothetical protein
MWCWWAMVAQGASPEQTEVMLDRVRASLERVRSSRVSPQLLETLPSWLDLTAAELSEDPGDLGVLQKTLSSGRPVEKAIAARWAAASADPAAVVALEAALQDERGTGWLPQTVPTQQISVRPEIVWVSPTVSAVALRSLSQLIGQSFADVAQYQQWREDHPDPGHSPDVWRQALLINPDRSEQLVALGPELSLRVQLLQEFSDDLRPEWKKLIGPQRTEALILGTERWPEHSDPHVFGQFVSWAVFELELPTLERWWAEGIEPAWARTSLALALGRADPAQREAVLVEVLKEPGSGPIDGVLAELVQHHARSQKALLAEYLSLPDGTDSSRTSRVAILHALADGGRASKDELVTLLGASQFESNEPWVVEALARAARKTGLVEEPCQGPFSQQAKRSTPPDVAELTDMLLQRKLCVAAVMAEVR